MYIAQAARFRHDFWRYILGILLTVAAIFIGQVPISIALLAKYGLDFAGKSQAELLGGIDNNLVLFLMLLSFAIGLVGLLSAVRYIHGQPFLSLTTSRKKIDKRRIGFGFGIVAIYSILATVIGYLLAPGDFQLNFQFVPFLVLCVIAVVMIPLQTSFEEYLFRGYLMQGIGLWAKNKWVPLVITSVIFGGLHLFNPEVTKMGYVIMVYYIGTGFFLGIITLMDEGMELALGFHAGNNLIGVLLVTADWTAFQTHSVLKDISEPSAGIDILIPVLVFYPLFLWIMAKKYKWKNWKRKLFGRVEG